MANKHPYEVLLEQIAELMRFALECAERPLNEENVPPDFEMRLDNIEKGVSRLELITDAMIEDFGMDKEKILDQLDEITRKLPERERTFVDRLNKLKQQAEEAARGFVKPAAPSQPKKKGDEKPKSRKSKFKRQGIDTKWKPL